MKVGIYFKEYKGGRVFLHKRLFGDARTLLLSWEKMKREHLRRKNSRFKYFTVHHSKATPPPPDQNESDFWCPYCRSTREFTYSKSTETHHCEICNISHRDFYVRKYNNLDPSWEDIQRMRSKK